MRRWSFKCNPSCQRLYSTARRLYSVLVAPPCQRIEIPRAGNVKVSISLYEPLIKTQSAPSAVLLFPRGLSEDGEAEDIVINALRSTISHHVIQVRYKFDKQHPFPAAIYDSVAAFDWAVENILASNAGKSARNGGIATCGELFGGALAAMLALTECRAGQPRVLASAVNNPILDWVNFEPVQKTKGRKAKNERPRSSIVTADALTRLRDQASRKPADYYDPFMSPLLFFRSAGSIPPAPAPQKSDMEEAFEAYAEDIYAVPLGQAEEATTPASPRSSRQFPSRALGLTLPKFLITTGSDYLLEHQAHEFVQQYSQSILRQRKARPRRRSRYDEDAFFDHDPLEEPSLDDLARDQVEYVDARVRFAVNSGEGLWDDTPRGRAIIHDMVNWLRESLQPP